MVIRPTFALTLLAVAATIAACSGGSSSPSSPTPTATTASSSTTTTATTTPTTPAPTPTPAPTTPTTPAQTACRTFGNKEVTLGRTSAAGAFTHAPFNASDLSIITNGSETNDPRFSYQWIKARGSSVNIYAPTDGVLIRLRHKTRNAQFDSDDFDLFFLVACNPERSGEGDTIVRFNHITDPRADFRAAYAAGSLPAPDITAGIEYEDRQVPLVNIAVKAGDLLGSTRGTPTANDFDFQVAVNDVTVCPFSVLNEPHKTNLLNLMGPQSRTPNGPPVAGYPCTGYGGRP